MEVELGDVHLCIDFSNETAVAMIFLKALLVDTKDLGKIWAFGIIERIVVLLQIDSSLRRR